MMNQSEYNKLF